VDPEVQQTDEPYVFVNGDPLNATDPLGLCGSKGTIGYYPGNCAKTAAQSLKATTYIEAHKPSGGWSLTQALHSDSNYFAGVANGILSTVTFSQVHVPAPYRGALSWAYGTGTGFGIAGSVVGGGALIGASESIGDAAYASNTFGADSTLFGNSTLGSGDDAGLLNPSGSSWKVGWSVNGNPVFRIATPFFKHFDLLTTSGF
jgi:hypothetical protein